jgi:3'-phosphoadenosine 5'-phosphosulfate sulfotransferase (PAPS reductase)/FAD synthetase
MTRHILSLSGGKDSAALAVYLRDRVPDMEYIFHDTGKELPETYDYMARLESILGRPVTRTTSEDTFEHLPSMATCCPRTIGAGVRRC